ncbi:MAG: hypothetical protein WC745_00860 [Patescibacteria group bacterium]|jgi:hypothetical protein
MVEQFKTGLERFTENRPSGIEKITEKDIREMLKLSDSLFVEILEPNKMTGRPYFSSLTGLGEDSIGEGMEDNTKGALRQLAFAMAMTKHPLIEEIRSCRYKKKKRGADVDYEKMLVDEQILKGYKIIDLGCGKKPVMARVCRGLGADAWTADMISADDFSIKNPDSQRREEEIKKHIQVNLGDEKNSLRKTINLLLNRTGGGVDLVTEAFLSIRTIGRNYRSSAGSLIAHALLKDYGIHYNPTFEDDAVHIKYPGMLFQEWEKQDRERERLMITDF